jgi:hypothetical protein
MHRKRDDYEFNENEKGLLTKKIKIDQGINEPILLQTKPSTNTFVRHVDKFTQNSMLNSIMLSAQVFDFCIILFNFHENSHPQASFLIENDDLVTPKKYMKLHPLHLAQQQISMVKYEKNLIYLALVRIFHLIFCVRKVDYSLFWYCTWI